MVRILYVHHGKGIGGAPLSLLYLIRGLDRTTFEPTVLCIHESEAADLFRREGIETIVLPGLNDFSHTNVLWYPWWQLPKTILRLLQIPPTYRRFRRFLASRPFDIIHLNTSTLLAFGVAARKAGARVVWHIREPIACGYLGLRRTIVRRVIDRNADAIIPISHYDASQLIPTDRIHVVHNFVDFSVFDASLDGAAVRTELGIDPRAPVLLMLGGVNPVKGTREYVEAAARVVTLHPDAVFLVAGEVPAPSLRTTISGLMRYRRAVEAAIPVFHASSIRFIGVRRDVPRLLAACTALCFPSTTPHFARPVIEASAMGKPVVASDLGGPQELVVGGETGILVPACDSRALADAILRLLDTPHLADSMGSAGLVHARKHFDATINTREVIGVYKKLGPRS